MSIHKEGYLIILIAILILGLLDLFFFWVLPKWIFYLLLVASILFFGLIVQFFRNPKRPIAKFDDALVYAPADGKVVVIEETHEAEYFQASRIQVSIFMSPLNVHANRYPISGSIDYTKYHKGKYLVAWHPKSSTENERSTTVIKQGPKAILVRQIAGAVARRIRNYAQKDAAVKQGEELGFIKFGSRVDIFLPLDAKIKVQIGQKVKGNIDVLAKI